MLIARAGTAGQPRTPGSAGHAGAATVSCPTLVGPRQAPEQSCSSDCPSLRTWRRSVLCSLNSSIVLCRLNSSIVSRARGPVRGATNSPQPSGRGPAVALVAQRPDIGRDRCHLRRGKLCAAHRRHHASVLLRVCYAIGDRPGDRRKTAITPQPLAAREVGSQRSALAVRPVASFAGCATRLAVEDPLAERDLPGRCPRRSRQGACLLGARVRMDAFRRLRPLDGCRGSGSLRAGRGWSCGLDRAHLKDPGQAAHRPAGVPAAC
jgi:hypothetical protein